MTTNVLIAGGGPAGLEAALALHRLAGDRVATTVLAPEAEFNYRPLSVLAPFAEGGPLTYPLERIASDAGFTHVRDRLASVDAATRAIETAAGERLEYDALLIALGARAVAAYASGIAFTGTAADQERVHGLVQDVEGGYVKSVAFVVPPGPSWPLPLYELALMLAGRAYELGADIDLHFVTPEAEPLARFDADELRHLLDLAGIALHTETEWEPGLLDVQRVVTLPRLEGPAIAGLPHDEHGFLVIDEHCRVLDGVYAAGDATAYEVKHGGIACQMADAAADHIAALAGSPVTPHPFEPHLQGLLITDNWARYLREGGGGATLATRGLRWPPSKIAGRELNRYLKTIAQ